MSDFDVTPDALRASAAALTDESGRLEDILAALAQRVQTLEGDWNGAARDAYAQAQSDWTEALDDLRTLLASIAERTVEIADGYDADDKASAARFTHQS